MPGVLEIGHARHREQRADIAIALGMCGQVEPLELRRQIDLGRQVGGGADFNLRAAIA